MKTGLFLTSLCSLSATTSAWTNPSPESATSRRNFLDTAAKIVPLVVATEAFAEDEAPAAEPAVAEAPAVEEPAPAAPTNDNEFIAKLLQRTEANKEKNLKLSQRGDKLSSGQFRSQYDRPSFVGVHSATDSEKVTMILKEEFDKMLANGTVKQTYESKVSKKSGEISDDYSKPIYVFAN